MCQQALVWGIKHSALAKNGSLYQAFCDHTAGLLIRAVLESLWQSYRHLSDVEVQSKNSITVFLCPVSKGPLREVQVCGMSVHCRRPMDLRGLEAPSPSPPPQASHDHYSCYYCCDCYASSSLPGDLRVYIRITICWQDEGFKDLKPLLLRLYFLVCSFELVAMCILTFTCICIHILTNAWIHC